MKKNILLELNVKNNKVSFHHSIENVIIEENEQNYHDELVQETIQTITQKCDKVDYLLACSSGIICGMIDIFLIGKPGDSSIGDINDKWISEKVISFAKMCGYKRESSSASSAIKFLERKFSVPYDQSVGGDIFKEFINLTPSNHHFKSLGHNPTLMGLFFSILNQFTNTSSFVSNGELICLSNNDKKYELIGNNLVSKIFCGFVNWIGHLISDVSGSSNSKGRGMGIPSPLLSWSNDIIVIKRKFNIPASEFDKYFNELALNLFEKGYDIRSQEVQFFPVLINEMIVRLLYSTRRIIKYFIDNEKTNRSLVSMWNYCSPFSNLTVNRMLTVAYGTFCLIDIVDATVRSSTNGIRKFDLEEFILRLNIIGVGRFTISVYGEIKNQFANKKSKCNNDLLLKKRKKLEFKQFANICIDKMLLNFNNNSFRYIIFNSIPEKIWWKIYIK